MLNNYQQIVFFKFAFSDDNKDLSNYLHGFLLQQNINQCFFLDFNLNHFNKVKLVTFNKIKVKNVTYKTNMAGL